MADVITRFKVETKEFDAKIKRSKSSLDGFSKAFKGSMTSMVGWTAAIAAAGRAANYLVQTNREFEQANANLAAVLGASRDQISALTVDAQKLGATTMFTAQQVTGLQTELAKLGFSQGEIKNVTKDVLNLAAATGSDLSEAASLAGAAMRGFGMQSSEMSRVASVLAVSTTKSALSMDKLGTALPIVQTTASKTGFSIEDTAAMLGKLTDNGIDAASAATQLRKVMNDATTAGTKLANYLGGPVHSLDELAEKLALAAKNGMKHADSVAVVNSKNATALDILRDMSVAVDGDTSSLVKLRDELTGCSKELQDMVDTQMDTLNGSWLQMKSAWDGLMLSFSGSNGLLKKTTDALTKLLTAWSNWQNRVTGGDMGIATFEKGANTEAADAKIQEMRASGKTDKQIHEASQKVVDRYTKERDAAKALYDQLAQIEKLSGAEHDAAMTQWNQDFRNMFSQYNVRTDGAAPAYLMRQIAKTNDNIATAQYMADVTAAPTVYNPGNTSEGDDDPVKSQVKRLKALEAAQIASLDRQTMNEEEYEDKVYEIKRASLEKQQALYNSGTDQYIDYSARISNLDTQHQSTVYRRDQRSARTALKYSTETGPSGYSQENIRAMQEELRKQMASMQLGDDDYMAAMAQSIDLTTFTNIVNEAIKNGVQIDPATLEGIFEQMFNGENIPGEVWIALADTINEHLAELDIKPIEVDVQTGTVSTQKDAEQLAVLGENAQKAWAGATSAIGSVGSALQSLDDPGAKVAGIIATAIANVAAGLGQMLAEPGATSEAWGWVALAASGAATMVSTIAAIKSATSGYAQGGIVGSLNGSLNSPSGDNIVARLNAGEGVLTRTGIETAQRMSQGGGMANLHFEKVITGSDIRLILTNDNRARGGSRGAYAIR